MTSRMDETAARVAVLEKLAGWGGWWANADDRWDRSDMDSAVEAIEAASDFIQSEADAIAQAVRSEREFLTRDHPMANGRQPQPGEQAWIFTLPLQDGTTLTVKAGRIGRDALIANAHQEATDDVLAAALRAPSAPAGERAHYAEQRWDDLRTLASQLAFALAGYHGGAGTTITDETRLLVDAANAGLLPAEWIERR